MRPSWTFEIKHLPAEQNRSQCLGESPSQALLKRFTHKTMRHNTMTVLGHYIMGGFATWYRLLKQFMDQIIISNFIFLKTIILVKYTIFLVNM